MIVTQQGFDENGIEVAVDLSRLIENVHVAPSLPSWIKSLVNGVLDRYGLAVRVHQSSLDDSPSW
ncbi:MAG: hypothetical protein IH899_17560 [Planctomycetes bacterium]|nr:hypothetical protein [Planctomycetota bacterium]